MKNHLLWCVRRAVLIVSLLPLFAVALSLSSCEVARQTAFNEAEFKWTRGKGTGAVEGQAYIEMRDKSVNVGTRSYIVLFPVNAYTTEFMTRQYAHGEHLALADDRMARYLCDETADENGNFSMRNLAPGDYYVGTMVHWKNHYWSNDSNNNLEKITTHHAQYIYARVTVRNGHTTRVTDWNQGADRNLDDIIH
jgi:hypothetical protein